MSVILLVSAFGLLILWIISRAAKSANGAIMAPTVNPKPNPSSVDQQIDQIVVLLTNAGYSPELARWFAAVSQHETGNFTSNLYRNANNLFGMGVPKVRRSTRSGEYKTADGRVYSAYSSTKSSIDDFIIYLQSMNCPVSFSTVDNLIAWMKGKGYFEDSLVNYIAGVKRFVPAVVKTPDFFSGD